MPHLICLKFVEAQILAEEADEAGREIAEPPDDAADAWYSHQSGPPGVTSDVRVIAFCYAAACERCHQCGLNIRACWQPLAAWKLACLWQHSQILHQWSATK